MSVYSEIVAAFFGDFEPPRSTFGGLVYRGEEVVDAGYRRQEIPKGSWVVDDATATATVRFGPFRRAVQVDGAILSVGGSVEVRLFDGDLRLLPGMEFEHDFVVEVAGG